MERCEVCGRQKPDVRLSKFGNVSRKACQACIRDEVSRRAGEVDSETLILKTTMIEEETFKVMSIIETERDARGNLQTLGIEPEEFYRHVGQVVREMKLPLKVAVRDTRWEVPFEEYGELGSEALIRQYLPEEWYAQFTEKRPRLVLQLENHFYSFIKIIIGMDKLGKFVKVSTVLMEDPPRDKFTRPVKPHPNIVKANPGTNWIAGGLLALVGTVIVGPIIGPTLCDNLRRMLHFDPGQIIFFGFALLFIAGIVSSIHGSDLNRKANAEIDRKEREMNAEYEMALTNFERYIKMRAQLKKICANTRGFKDDDLIILCHSIQRVVNHAIDELYIDTKRLVVERDKYGDRLFASAAESGFSAL
jgi:hypothetical protein